MVGFAKRRATWQQPLQLRRGERVVYDERTLRTALSEVINGGKSGLIVFGDDIFLQSPLDVGDFADGDVVIDGRRHMLGAVSGPLTSAFEVQGSHAPNTALRLRDLLIGGEDTNEAAPFTSLVRQTGGVDVRVDVRNSRIYTSTGLINVTGGSSKTLREAQIVDNDIVGSVDWEFLYEDGAAAVAQFCRLSGNNCIADEMNFTDYAAGGGRNIVTGNQFSGGEIITSAGSGFNVLLANTLVTITAHANDEVVGNT